MKTPPGALWITDSSAEADSMQGCNVAFWEPVAFFNADLAGTQVQCLKCRCEDVITSGKPQRPGSQLLSVQLLADAPAPLMSFQITAMDLEQVDHLLSAAAT